jgi:heme exporter protein D
MNHLPYIVAAYGLTLGVVVIFAVNAWQRTNSARRRLAALDTRDRR